MLKELNLQNPWWLHKENIHKDDKVKIAVTAKPPIKYNFVKKNMILLGPRQVGKTTYLKLFIKNLIEKGVSERNIIYFSCEPLSGKKDLIELFRKIHELSYLKGKKYIFLDEVTSVNEWDKAIKYFLEQKIISNFQIICTGSNAHLLKKGSERFPGRDISTKLFLPLTFSEYIKNLTQIDFSSTNFTISQIYQNSKKLYPLLNKVNKIFREFLITGGVPKSIYKYKKVQRIDSETYELYAKWILGGLSNFGKKESIFRPLIKGIIEKYSTKVSLNSLATDFQIPTHTTVETYLELLNQLLLINVLYKVEPNKKVVQFRKEKKIYFQDPFFYNVFKGFTYGQYKDYSENNENLIEGVVCQELASLFRKGPEISEGLWYYDAKRETDFVLKKGNELIGIEVKWSSSIKVSEFNNRFLFKERVILSKDILDYDKEKNIYIIPLSLFLLSISKGSKIYK